MKKISQRGLFPAIGDQFGRFGGWLLGLFTAIKVFLFGQPEKAVGDGNDRIYKNVTVASVLVSMILFTISFVGSYTAARAFALDNGIAPTVAGWIPVSIDGFIGLGILVIFGASLVGARVGWVKAVVLLCVGVSTFFNIQHIIIADYKGFEHYLLGAIFPTIVFLSAEITSRQIRDYIERRGGLLTNAQLTDEIATLVDERGGLEDEIETERAQLLAAAQQFVRAAVAELEEHRTALASQNAAAARQLKKLKAKVETATQTNITAEDIQIAVWIGQDSSISGREIGERLKKSSQTGNNKKNRVFALLNGRAKCQ